MAIRQKHKNEKAIKHNKIKFEYEYVLVTWHPKTQAILNIIGTKNLDVLIGLVSNCALDRKIGYTAFTKADADKKRFKPTICCMGPAEKTT